MQQLNLNDSREHKIKLFLIGICLFPSFLVNLNIHFINLLDINLALPIQAFAIITGLVIFREQLLVTYREHKHSINLLALFNIWIWVSALCSHYENIAIKFAFKYTLYFALFFLFLVLTHQLKQYSRFIECYQLILYYLIILTLFGFIEKINPDASLFIWLRPPDLLFNDAFPTSRVLSLLQNPNDFGALMALGLVLSIVFYKQKNLSTSQFVFTALALTANIIFSASRNAWISLLIIGLFALIYYKLLRGKYLYLILAFTITFFIFNPQSLNRITQSIYVLPQNLNKINSYFQNAEVAEEYPPHRILIWTIAIEQFKQYPLTGIGPQGLAEGFFANHPQVKSGMNAHNLILGILVEFGLPGLLIFCSLLYCFLHSVDYSNPLWTLPMLTMFMVQIFDYFIHALPFVTIMLLIIALTTNSKFIENIL